MSFDDESKIPKVCIQECSYENIDIKSLLKPLGGLKKYIDKNDKVLLKTNLLNATNPDKAVITHPNLIKSLANEVFKLGATPFIGDSPSGRFSKGRLKRVYDKSGLIDLSKEIGIKLNYDTSSKKVKIPDGKALNKTSICNFVLNSDKIISLPKLKTHYYMIMSLATKIMYGSVPGLKKAYYHSRFINKNKFSDMLLDILSVTYPDLVIMDGIVAMQGKGPMSGETVDLNLLFASDNSYAVDIAVCNILDIEPMGIPVLKQSKIRKLLPKEINYPLLSPKEKKYKGFELPSAAEYLLTGENPPEEFPIITEKCRACRECVIICPKKAIQIKENKANVNYKKCIRCYCCHEVCTYNAIELEKLKDPTNIK